MSLIVDEVLPANSSYTSHPHPCVCLRRQIGPFVRGSAGITSRSQIDSARHPSPSQAVWDEIGLNDG